MDKINSCVWFENCGDGFFDRFEVIVVTDRDKAIKSVTSMKWGNICLGAQNDLTEYLFFNLIFYAVCAAGREESMMKSKKKYARELLFTQEMRRGSKESGAF